MLPIDHADAPAPRTAARTAACSSVSAGLPGLNGSSVKAVRRAVGHRERDQDDRDRHEDNDEDEAVEHVAFRRFELPCRADTRYFSALSFSRKFLAGLEERHPFLLDLDGVAGARIAARRAPGGS